MWAMKRSYCGLQHMYRHVERTIEAGRPNKDNTLGYVQLQA